MMNDTLRKDDGTWVQSPKGQDSILDEIFNIMQDLNGGGGSPS